MTLLIEHKGVLLTTTLPLRDLSPATPVRAQDATRIEAIQQQIDALQKELRVIKGALAKRDAQVKAAQSKQHGPAPRPSKHESSATEAKQQPAAAEATVTAAAPIAEKPPQATLDMRNGRPSFTSADGKFSASVGLQLNYDFGGYFTGPTPNPDNRSAILAPFGENLRRARIPFQFRYEDFTAAGNAGFRRLARRHANSLRG